MTLRALVFTLLVVPATLSAQVRLPKDSVLLTRDIDGSGKPDRIVLEFRRGKKYAPSLLSRTAIYLDQRLRWSSDWNDELASPGLDTTIVVPGGGSLVQLGLEFGDAGMTTLLFARNGSVRVLLQHAIDYDNGDYRLRAAAKEITVDVSLDHLEVGGKQVASYVRCREGTIAMAQLVFDSKRQVLTPRRQYCESPHPAPPAQ